jgi:hypothetical protein
VNEKGKKKRQDGGDKKPRHGRDPSEDVRRGAEENRRTNEHGLDPCGARADYPESDVRGSDPHSVPG